MEFDNLIQRIEIAYQELGHTLGWRFLTSSQSMLSPNTEAAFITLNPGGNKITHQEQKASCENGSPYLVERWKNAAPGEAPLQRQIRALYSRLGWGFDAVLSGQLVPFRSPSWDALSRPKESLKFGERIWGEILDYVRPRIVVAMGKSQLREPLRRILGTPDRSFDVPVAWGNITAGLDLYPNCRLISLPHLSRFPIITRPQSQPALNKLFGA